MDKKYLLKKMRRDRQLLIRLILVFISMGLFVISQVFIKKNNEDVYIIIVSIAASVLATVIVSFVTQAYDGKNIEDEIIERFDELRIYQKYSLRAIYNGFPFEEDIYRNAFVNSKRVVIVMNDAKAFISNNYPLFSERLKQKKYETILIIEDYKKNDIIEVLNKKNGHAEGYYQEKIREVIKYDLLRLYKEGKNSNHTVKVLLNQNINTLGVILTDEYAMVSIYRVSGGKTTVPHFIFESTGCEYDEVKNDIEKLIDEKTNNTKAENMEAYV